MSYRARLFVVAVLIIGAMWSTRTWRNANTSAPTTSISAAKPLVDNFQTQARLDIAAHGGVLVHSNGTIWLWGQKTSMDENIIPLPQGHQARPLSGLTHAVSASMTDGYILALRDDGTVWGMGDTAGGQLGIVFADGRMLSREWTQVPNMRDAAQVLATRPASFIVKKDGTVWASGINEWGRLGEGFTAPISKTHVKLPNLSGIRQLEASDFQDTYYALRDDGRVLAWGRRYALGLPYQQNAPEYLIAPQLLEGLENVVAITGARAGQYRLVAKRNDGSVVLWGGHGVSNCDNQTPTPLVLPELHNAISIAAGTIDIYAVKPDGSFWRWGLEDINGVGVCMAAPKEILPPGSATSVVSAGLSNALLMHDGSVSVWGNTLGIQSSKNPHAWLDFAQRKTIDGLPSH